MFKKLSMAFIAALLMLVAFAGVAAAQTDTPTDGDGEGRLRTALGQVVSIGDSFFTMTVRRPEATILVTDDTVFKNRDGSTASLGDLEVDRWVLVTARKNEDGDFTARRVILMPEGFDPADLNLVRMSGEVDKINNGQNTFTITKLDGESVTLNVDGNTRWLGALSELKDLEKGMKVGVVAKGQEDGSLLAKIVAARDEDSQGGRAIGQVSVVGTSDLTVETRRSVYTFLVDEDTQFISRDGSVDSLEDLEAGMKVVVVFVIQDDDSLLAKRIGAAAVTEPPSDGDHNIA
ncbi:MAG: DUF5666 domain-containing protein [Anaerolineales bacterium]|jgi:hypothetical protein